MRSFPDNRATIFDSVTRSVAHVEEFFAHTCRHITVPTHHCADVPFAVSDLAF